jgi:intraflagellar transport protein 172
VSLLYEQQAQLMESQGKFTEAERMYLDVSEPDLAINMYKKARMYDRMIALVSKYRKELLAETHSHLARQFEAENNLKVRHFRLTRRCISGFLSRVYF